MKTIKSNVEKTYAETSVSLYFILEENKMKEKKRLLIRKCVNVDFYPNFRQSQMCVGKLLTSVCSCTRAPSTMYDNRIRIRNTPLK